MTVIEAIQAYLAEARPDVLRITQARRDRFAGRWVEWLGADREISTITVDELRDHQARLRRIYSADSTNQHLKFLKGVMRLAIEEGHLAGRNPVARIRKLMTPPLSLDYLSDAGEETLRQHCDGDLWAMVQIAIHTGMRQGEQLGVQRLDVDLEVGVIRLPRTKNGDARIVHLNSIALELVRHQLASRESPWLYPSTRDEQRHVAASLLRRRWRAALESAGLHLRWHDLRATCVTRLLEEGVHVDAVREQIGHRTLAMVMRYSRLSSERQRAAVERLAKRARRNKRRRAGPEP